MIFLIFFIEVLTVHCIRFLSCLMAHPSQAVMVIVDLWNLKFSTADTALLLLSLVMGSSIGGLLKSTVQLYHLTLGKKVNKVYSQNANLSAWHFKSAENSDK